MNRREALQAASDFLYKMEVPGNKNSFIKEKTDLTGWIVEIFDADKGLAYALTDITPVTRDCPKGEHVRTAFSVTEWTFPYTTTEQIPASTDGLVESFTITTPNIRPLTQP